MHIRPTHRLVFWALVLVQILFGINYTLSKVVISVVPPLVWASFRGIVIAAIMLVLAHVFRREQRPKLDADFVGGLILFSFFGIILNQALFLIGLHHTSSTNASILCTLIPVFTLMIVTAQGHETSNLRKSLGFLFAFFGVLLMLRIENFDLGRHTLLGNTLIVINSLSYALFLSFGKRFLMKHDKFWVTAYLFTAGSVGLTILALPDWLEFSLPSYSFSLVSCALFAILGGTLLTYFLNIWALAHTYASRVALFIYIQPLVAATLGIFFLGETLTPRTLFSAGLIFCGVYLTLSKRSPLLRWLSLKLRLNHSNTQKAQPPIFSRKETGETHERLSTEKRRAS